MPFILLEIAKSTIGTASTLGQDLSDAPENWPAALPEVSDRPRPASGAPVQCSMVTPLTRSSHHAGDEFRKLRERRRG